MILNQHLLNLTMGYSPPQYLKTDEELRTIKHNKFYWALLRNIETLSPCSAEDLHELFKYLFNINTTTVLTTEELGIYTEGIIDYCIQVFKIDPLEFEAY